MIQAECEIGLDKEQCKFSPMPLLKQGFFYDLPFFFLFKTRACYVAQAGLDIFLPSVIRVAFTDMCL